MEIVLSTVVSSFTASVLFFIFQLTINWSKKRSDRLKIEDRSEKDALQAILMERLEEKHDLYVQRGYATFREKNIYSKMYNSYHNLGKNGVMTSAYQEVLGLPTAPEPEDK